MSTTQQPAQQHDVLEEEPSDIAEHASEVGAERLRRPAREILVTSIIGGGEVSIGGLAAMAVVGSALKAVPGLELYAALALGGLVFPIGFLFVIVGRSELFTENFLIPVVAVFYKREHTVRSLAQLWVVSWVGNLVGCAGTALLLLVPAAIGEPVKLGYTAYTSYKLDVPLVGVFVSAVLAGAVMTTLTWVLLSLKDSVSRMLAIAAAGYVLFAANLSHSIVSASILFAGFPSTEHSFANVMVWLLVATCGNLVGGLGLVTMFRLTQAEQQR
jgi:formate-nitrite transporter family protein